MIKFTATSLIHSISPVLQVTDRFQKRELVLNDSWERNGEVHPNFVLVEFTGEKMALLDNFAPGQRVNVEAIVNGREKEGRFYNSLRGLSISAYQPQQPGPYVPPQQMAPQGYPAPQYGQPSYPQTAPMSAAYPQQAPAYPPQPQYPPQQYQQAPPQGPTAENLPFKR